MLTEKTCDYSAEDSLLRFVNLCLREHAEEKQAYSATKTFCRRLSSVHTVLAFQFIFLSVGFLKILHLGGETGTDFFIPGETLSI